MRVWDVEFGMLKTGHLHGEPDDSSRSFVAHLISGKKHIGDVPVCFARCRFHFKMKYEEQVSSLRVKGIGPQLSHIHYMTKTEQFSKWTSQRPLLKKKHFPRGTNPCATMIGPQQSVGNTQIWHVSCEHGSQIRF